jgi:hypothetical protein
VLFIVTSGREPFVALVGSRGERPPAIVVVPARLVLTLPGAGSGTVADAAAASGSLLAASISNALGTWVGPQFVTDLSGLAGIVDATGGVSVDLVQPAEVSGQEIGPGPVSMDGREASTFLSDGVGLGPAGRWQEMLSALFKNGLSLPPQDLARAVRPDAVRTVFATARSPRVRELPATPSEGRLLVPDDPAIRRALSSLFGVETKPPVDVVVLNGSGVPGVGETVASRLVPGGFRIAASGNARGFDHQVTEIVADTDRAKAQAQRVRRLLGVGTVVLGTGSSGLADITIVVGRDFTAG